MNLGRVISFVVIALCITALGLFGSGDAAASAFNLLYLLIGSRLRF
jgi:hypothetical protein